MSKVFIVDIARCTGCYNCQLVCKDEHCGNDWSPYAKAQPMTGQFWCKVHDHVQGTIPKVKIHHHATILRLLSLLYQGPFFRRFGTVLVGRIQTKCRP